MKLNRVNTNKIGLVFKGKELKSVLTKGNYWFFKGEAVYEFCFFEEFPMIEKGIFDNLLLSDHLELIEVLDNELVLVFEHNNFKGVLSPGVHAFWKGKHKFHFQKVSLSNYIIEGVEKIVLERPELNSYVRSYRIEAYEKGLLFVDGLFIKVLNPGNHFWWKNSEIIHVTKCDVRKQTMEILGQEILTKDKVQLRLNFGIQYQVNDLIKAYVETKDFEKQLYGVVQMCLRALVGTLTFDELMDQKNEVGNLIMSEIESKASQFGVLISDSGLKDVILPGEIRDIMNQVLIAEKRAQANSIMRREETASTRSLLNTARLMKENQMLYKLKEMEYIEKISEKINSISVSGSNNVVSELKQIFTK